MRLSDSNSKQLTPIAKNCGFIPKLWPKFICVISFPQHTAKDVHSTQERYNYDSLLHHLTKFISWRPSSILHNFTMGHSTTQPPSQTNYNEMNEKHHSTCSRTNSKYESNEHDHATTPPEKMMAREDSLSLTALLKT